MPFIKYPHIERLGNDEVEDITLGKCHIFPKIDGTQSSVWWDGGLKAASRRRELTLEEDNAEFYAYVLNSDLTPNLNRLLSAQPDWTLYGEWLVPHTLKTYRDDAWRKLYIFDVFDVVAECFLDYDYYAPILDQHSILYIPLLESITNPTEDHLVMLLDRNTYLIKDGCGVGEGIVIKRYDFVNRYGRTVWAKVVRNEFKEQNRLAFGAPDGEMVPLELRIARWLVTEGRVSKAKDKMRENGPVSSHRIPELFGRIWHEIVADEMWNVLKKFKNPTVNFRRLYQFVIGEAKVYSPELFGGVDGG